MTCNMYNLLSYPIIPTIYEDSLSYYEVLCALDAKIDAVIKNTNDYAAAVLAEAKSYTDNSIREFYSYTDERVNGVDQKYENITDAINQKIIDINQNISKLYLAFSDLQNTNQAQLDLMYKKLKEYVDSLVLSQNFYFIDPTTGNLNDLQSILNNMYKALSWASLTAEEYDNMQLTAGEYDSLQLTAYDYDHYARLRFFNKIYFSMISPFTGVKDSYSNIINKLASLHKNGLTAKEYDDLQLTASVYDGKNITAYEYDWNSKNLLQEV